MNEKNGERRPIASGWVSLEQGKGIKWILWSNNVTFQRQEKKLDQWVTTEELHAPASLLKEIAWRVSRWLEVIEQKTQESRESGK